MTIPQFMGIHLLTMAYVITVAEKNVTGRLCQGAEPPRWLKHIEIL